jgi:tRNA (guanine-N7-)-methyltransferase
LKIVTSPSKANDLPSSSLASKQALGEVSARGDTNQFIYTPPSWFERLDWEKVFAPTAASNLEHRTSNPPIHVDLGAGDGGFIRDHAKNHPDTHFLAVERLLGRVRKISRRAFRAELTNVRVLRMEIAYAVEWLFPPKSVDSMTILFPDPWPKRRHLHKRLITGPFLDLCAQSLKPNGWIAMKTDDPSYGQQIQQSLQESQLLQVWKEADASSLIPELTDFEKIFIKEGRSIHFAAARPKL